MSNAAQPTVLLLQARRPDDSARHDEHRSFARQAGLAPERVITWDLLSGVPDLRTLWQYDALMIGGSGDFYVSKRNLPHNDAVLDLLRAVVDRGHPTFASCFGFHLITAALGGSVIYDPEQGEVGTYLLTLTDAGANDELFGRMPRTFRAQLGHKDRVTQLPAGVVHLASSERAPFQALRVPGKPIWATQFHPELTGAENLRRFEQYMDGYAKVYGPDQLQETLARFDASPATDSLLSDFTTLVLDC